MKQKMVIIVTLHKIITILKKKTETWELINQISKLSKVKSKNPLNPLIKKNKDKTRHKSKNLTH